MAPTPEDFLLEDYKQKISYLTNHLGRMWTRFNFFVTIESALLGGKVLLVSDKPSPMAGVAGIILSLVWYIMGAQDRFLADFYRWHVKEAASRVRDVLNKSAKGDNNISEDMKLYENMLKTAVRAAATDHVGSLEDDSIKQYRSWRDGKFTDSLSRSLERLSTWRSKRFSTTHLAAWIPLVALILWLGYLIIQLSMTR